MRKPKHRIDLLYLLFAFIIGGAVQSLIFPPYDRSGVYKILEQYCWTEIESNEYVALNTERGFK